MRQTAHMFLSYQVEVAGWLVAELGMSHWVGMCTQVLVGR